MSVGPRIIYDATFRSEAALIRGSACMTKELHTDWSHGWARAMHRALLRYLKNGRRLQTLIRLHIVSAALILPAQEQHSILRPTSYSAGRVRGALNGLNRGTRML